MEWMGTYTARDAEARGENGDKKRNGNVYTTQDVTKPIDLIHCNAKLRGS